MKYSLGYLIAFLLQTGLLVAQVGINNPNPQATLDVNGSVLIHKQLYLENPGYSDQIRGSNLLIQKTNKQIVQYDIDQSKYGPINYAQFIFANTNTKGLKDYDTKISASEYIVTVQGFYFLKASTNNTNITIKSSNGNIVEGFQIYAYVDDTTNSWHIKGVVNNGKFQDETLLDTQIDLYMNLIIFRNRFIAKQLADVVVIMQNEETKTVDVPLGF